MVVWRGVSTVVEDHRGTGPREEEELLLVDVVQRFRRSGWREKGGW